MGRQRGFALLVVLSFLTVLAAALGTGAVAADVANMAVSDQASPSSTKLGNAYPLDTSGMHRMPTHFGPRTGPRRGPNGEKFDDDRRKTTTIAVSFLTNKQQLTKLLPPGFSVDGEPVVSVFASYMTEIPWLAGRGYNVLGVRFPAKFSGEADQASGDFLLVLWENLTDPILTGREELGFSKIYADLPEPRTYAGETHAIASWMGFKFLDVRLKNMKKVELTAEQSAAMATGDPENADGELKGLMHYKYMPRTGEWGAADIAYATLTPAGGPSPVILEYMTGDGTVDFHKARWEDMPTQFNIVNGLEALEIREYRGAQIIKSVGGGGVSDLGGQRILK